MGIASDEHINKECVENWKGAIKDLRGIQELSKEKRVKFLEDLATKYTLQNYLSQEKEISELLSHEKPREIFKDIRIGL